MGGVAKNLSLYQKRVDLMLNFLTTKLRMRPGLVEEEKSENNSSHCLMIINNSNMHYIKLNPLMLIIFIHKLNDMNFFFFLYELFPFQLHFPPLKLHQAKPDAKSKSKRPILKICLTSPWL